MEYVDVSTIQLNNKPYYVLLTGSKNNAGDYLIKYRAKELFKALRPDREVYDVDSWITLDKQTLNLLNNSQAVILMGGPALQKNMYPNIYPLCENLDLITAPIVTMGIGWKSLDGAWSKSRAYPLSKSTIKLLDKIDSTGVKSSVRDYHTLNALQSLGYESFIMTGCPALNDLEHLEQPTLDNQEIKRVSFSLGVSFLESHEMLKQMKGLILRLKEMFSSSEFEVIFHHSLSNEFLDTHNATSKHLTGHKLFSEWLSENNVKYKDISGSAEKLVECYSRTDLHIGYRVHAHIFMTSIGKRSVLITEDGRGKALKDVISGMIFEGFNSVSSNIVSKILRKLSVYSGYKVDKTVPIEILRHLKYEIENDYPRMRKTQLILRDNSIVMKTFISELP
ncbi:MAG: hypothetical protein ACJAS9_003148 [Polaribacter sp.]